MIPSVVDREQLMQANGLFVFTLQASFVVGFAVLGPLFLRLLGPQLLIVVVAGCYLIAAGLCWVLPSTGSIDSWERPASFSTRFVIWLLTWEAISDCAPKAPGGVGLAAAASEVFPKAIRLMMSEGGSDGSEA